MVKYNVERYFDTYPDGGDRIIKQFDDEQSAKKFAGELNFNNRRPYISYEVRQVNV